MKNAKEQKRLLSMYLQTRQCHKSFILRAFSKCDGKKAAFTIPEALLTLLIIGIVAAMVIPTIAANVQRHLWEMQLKETYLILNQGFRKIASENDGGLRATPLSGNYIFRDINGNNQGCATYNGSFIYPFVRDFARKTWKITDAYCNPNYSDPKTCSNTPLLYYGLKWTVTYWDYPFYPTFILSTGAAVSISSDFGSGAKYSCGSVPYPETSKLKTACAIIGMDTNGKKEPNRLGYDYFQFVLDNDGNLWPYSGAEYVKAMYSDGLGNSNYWKNNKYICCTKREKGCGWSQGIGCAGRVVESGWKIEY